MIKEYVFNTGVRPYDHTPPAAMAFIKGYRDSGNGVYVVPFTCEEVPNNFKFELACDTKFEETEYFLRREIIEGINIMLSKYAYFLKENSTYSLRELTILD